MVTLSVLVSMFSSKSETKVKWSKDESLKVYLRRFQSRIAMILNRDEGENQCEVIDSAPFFVIGFL